MGIYATELSYGVRTRCWEPSEMHHVESTLIARDGTWEAEILRQARQRATYGCRARRWVAEEILLDGSRSFR
jgi:hypothetical protein